MINVGILMFDEVEVLDFAGPFEVFGIAQDEQQHHLFNVFTVAQQRHIKTRHGLLVQANYVFYHHLDIDILVIPGGYGARTVELHNQELKEWVLEIHEKAQLTLSVCTGAFILAEMGLLDGLTATTHWREIERLRHDYPKIAVQQGARYIDQAKIVTSAGISSGIHAALHVVAKFCGSSIAQSTAKSMAFEWEDEL